MFRVLKGDCWLLLRKTNENQNALQHRTPPRHPTSGLQLERKNEYSMSLKCQ